MTDVQEPVFVYIEDDAPSRQIVSVLLSRVMKYQHVFLFEDTHDLVAKLVYLTPQPTVVFLDIQIKPHDGYEALRLLRADSRLKGINVIAMTANVMSHDVEKLKQAGFNGLIGKPIVNDIFPQLIDRILSGQGVWFVP